MFELSKWYADAVSAAGEVFLGYRAHLRTGPFEVRYASTLAPDPRHSIGGTALTIADTEIHWQAPALGIDARWQRRGREIRDTIYSTGEGRVEWHCLVPDGEAAIERNGKGTLTGLGYFEHLQLTIPPWRLPIRTLRWGRYLSARHSLIWIDWLGEYSTQRVYWNGAPVTAASLDDDGLVLSDGSRTVFDRSLTLRQGRLGSTVFSHVPGLERFAPARIFAIQETKWRSFTRFEVAGERADEGWSIHEVVQWP